VEECREVFGDRVALFSNSAGSPDDTHYRHARHLEEQLGLSVIRHQEKVRSVCAYRSMLLIVILFLLLLLLLLLLLFCISGLLARNAIHSLYTLVHGVVLVCGRVCVCVCVLHWNRIATMQKPEAKKDVLRHFGCENGERLLAVGDRYFTDVLFGNLCGMLTVATQVLTEENDPLVVRPVCACVIIVDHVLACV
jgi:Mitochondrial PGP phosphatase